MALRQLTVHDAELTAVGRLTDEPALQHLRGALGLTASVQLVATGASLIQHLQQRLIDPGPHLPATT